MKTLSLCTRVVVFVFVGSFFFAFSSSGQAFEELLVNKGSFFASASVLHDYDGDGDLDIVVTRKRDGSQSTGGMEWLENDGTGHFPRHVMHNDLHEPARLAYGDMDGDDDIDYVVADKGDGQVDGELVLFERQDDGTYIKWTLDAGERFDATDIADFDDDGDLDVVGVGFNHTSLYVWFNEGGLNFTKTMVKETISQARSAIAVDVDKDDDIDIVVDDFVLRNNGSGVFDNVKELLTSTSPFPSAGRGFAVDDLDGNGSTDIIGFRKNGSGGLYFFDGSNNFGYSSLDIDGIDLGGDVLIADLDDNGRKDIIRQNFGDDYVSVLYQTGQMTFEREIIEMQWDNDVRGSQMALGDLDGDNDPDLVFAEDGNVDGDISWFENIDGRLYRRLLYHEIKGSRVAKFGDMDGDGDQDMVVGAGAELTVASINEHEILWYENRGTEGYFESRIEDNILYAFDLEIADLDGDNTMDLIATDGIDNKVYWYEKNGLEWDKQVIEDNANLPRGIVAANVDGEGGVDIVLANSGDNKVFWYQNNGGDDFTRNVVDANLSEPLEVEAADLNDDGHIDIVAIATDLANAVVVYMNDGNETFSREIIFTDHLPKDLEIGDWTGNEAPDIIVGFNTQLIDDDMPIVLFSNDGTGSFTPESEPLYVDNQEGISAVKLADADRDGDLDLFFAQKNLRPSLALIPNEGGTPGEMITLRHDNFDDFNSLDAADLDNDGDVDVVTAGPDSESLYLYTNTDLEPVAIEGDETPLPAAFVLQQNYPNPFNPETTITFTLAEPAQVELRVFDLLGREVAMLFKGQATAGPYSVTFEASNLPSGLYLYRLITPAGMQTKSMVLLK